MMRALVFTLTAAACGSHVDRPSGPPPPMHAAAICPASGEIGIITNLWAHQLFPGCPPPQFPFGVTCDGGVCPSPCARSNPHKTTYSYEGGQFASSSAPDTNGPFEEHCTYADGAMTACETNRARAFTLTRDAQGRITKIAEGAYKSSGDLAISYDQRGRVAEIANLKDNTRVTMRYDGEGRLVAEDAHRGKPIKYSYDGWDRPSGSSFGNRVVHYDERTGRVALVSRGTDFGRGPVTETDSFVYDDAGRPTTITHTTSDGDPNHQHVDHYDYDCKSAE